MIYARVLCIYSHTYGRDYFWFSSSEGKWYDKIVNNKTETILILHASVGPIIGREGKNTARAKGGGRRRKQSSV